ncbi:MAG TPA: hypothetical protein VKN76_16895 [Kiloniellaceae bacterium]|nr:hypothetical protein [Kiloniellaceae bacterium]
MIEYRCAVCGHDSDTTICRHCQHAVDRALDAITNLHTHLDPRRPATPPGERVRGTGEIPLPINITAVDLAAPARQPTLTHTARQWPQDHQGHQSVATTLDQWAHDWRDLRGHGERLPSPTVAELSTWLKARWGTWAAHEHPAAAEFADEMTELERTLRRVTGIDRDQTQPVGDCPGGCGTRLRATPWQTSVECRRCGTRWDRGQWGELAAAIREAA